MSVITVKNLQFKYPQSSKNAVDDISFVIEKGSYTAIVGYNGSGKSSLTRLLCGLENPDSGKIEIEKNQQIGIVFQSPKDQLVSGIVSRDTAFGPQNLGLSKSEVELRTIESLNIVDMLDRASSSSTALSLGQTQKVALSGVIALRPEILILDEAISMLDPFSRQEILEFVRYWHKCGNTIIQITHDIEVVNEADSVIGMENGKIFFYGTKRAFLENPENVKRIMGQPLEKTDKTLFYAKKNKEVSLSVRNLSFSYDSAEEKKRGVEKISFDLYKGTLTALTGPSGAGKSTILELCSGLLNGDGTTQNTAGDRNGDGAVLGTKKKRNCDEMTEVTAGGLDTAGSRNGGGMAMDTAGAAFADPGAFGSTGIFSKSRPVLAQQNAKAALFEAFAADDVAFGPRNQGKSGAELKEIVKKAMNAAYLPFDDFAERKTFALSGGEQRRLSIAGILALNSDVLLFDEPTAGLDSKARFEVMQMFRKLADEGKTVLFSTHKVDEADFADREIKIEKGKLVFDSNRECGNGSNEFGMTMDTEEGRKTDGVTLVAEKMLQNPALPPFVPSHSSGLLENLRNLSLGLSGANHHKKSLVEKLPASLRILLFLALFATSLAVRPTWLCGLLLLAGVFYCIFAGFSFKKLCIAWLKILPFLLIFTVFQLIFHAPLPNEPHFTPWKYFLITPSKIFFCLSTLLRTYSALACISAFFVSTPEHDLIDGLNILLTPLRLIKIPVRYLILIIEIIFRFMPLLVDEASSIIKTQIIRGGLEKVSGKMAKIKAIIPLIVPLIIQTIKKSEALADAITMRCFK